MTANFGSTSQMGVRARGGYFEDITSVMLTNNADSSCRSATIRRMNMAELKAGLRAETVEVAAVPAFELHMYPQYCVLPTSCISVMGPSNMFVLASKVFPGEISEVLVDIEDFGMSGLAQHLIFNQVRVRPEMTRSVVPLDPFKFDFRQDEHHAYLLCGRNALLLRRDAFAWSMDLSQSWYDLTKVPLVAHCWIAKKNLVLTSLTKELEEVARRASLEVNAIAAKEAEKLKIPPAGVEIFLSRIIRSHFGQPEVTSLRRQIKEMQMMQVMPQNYALTIYQEPVKRTAAR